MIRERVTKEISVNWFANHMVQHCIDPQMEFFLLKEISISNVEKRALELSPQLERQPHGRNRGRQTQGANRPPRTPAPPSHCFLGAGTDPRRMIFTARSPFSSLTHLTVTFCFSLGLPPWGCTTVSAVIAKLRTVALPNTVRVRVILSPAKAVTSPAKY